MAIEHFSESGQPIPAGIWRFAKLFKEASSKRSLDRLDKAWKRSLDRFYKVLRHREALSTSPQAPLTRKGTPVYNSEGGIAYYKSRPSGSHIGAQDASGSLSRLTDADDVPIDSFKSDVRRKVALKKVMPGAHDSSETEGIVGDVLGKILDDDEKCYDDDGNEIDCETGEPIEEVKRVVKKRSVAESAVSTFRENYGGMATADPTPSEKPESMSGLHGEELAAELAKKGITLRKEDGEVDFRYAADPSKACSHCKWFDGESGCAVVAGNVTTQTTSKLFTSASEAQATFANEYKPEP